MYRENYINVLSENIFAWKTFIGCPFLALKVDI
jgi:hypothetical protein